MSKQRKITKVQVETHDRGSFKSVWVHVFWDGTPDILPDGTEVHNRFHTATSRANQKGFDRILRRGRKMQDILLNQSEENNDNNH